MDSRKRCQGCGAAKRAFSSREGGKHLCVICDGIVPDPVIEASKPQPRFTFLKGAYTDVEGAARARSMPGQGGGS